MTSLTKKEIAEVERRTQEVISKKSPTEQRAELARVTKALGGRRTGYGKSASRRAWEKAQAKAAAERAALEAQRLAAAQRSAKAQRDLALRRQAELIKQGNQKRVQEFKNREGQRVRHTTVKNKRERIFITENLVTGEKTVMQFNKRGRRVSETTSSGRGASVSTPGIAARVKITKSSNRNKLIVTLPNGQRGTINARGRVIVGARLAGNQLEFQDGVLRKVDGVNLYEEKLSPIKAEPISKTFSTERLKSLSQRWKKDIQNTKTTLKEANSRGDLDRLKELRSIGGGRTQSQNTEYKKLKKQTAKNYELGGELVGKIIGTSLINMGVGTAALLKALKANPKETLIALPPAIYFGVKEDFNRVMSGDPLEVGSVGLEYFTFAKVGQIAGRAGKVGLKTSYGIGRTLSPKYFKDISIKLVSPPVTLRGLASKTATGRAAEKAVADALKRSGVSKNVAAFNKKLKAQGQLIDRKLTNIQRKSKAVKTKVKKKVKRKVDVVKAKRAYTKSLKDAKKSRMKAVKKGRTLPLTSPNYKQALGNINVLSDAIARVNTYNFLNKLTQRGGSLTKKQADKLLLVVKKQYKARMEAMPEYQALVKLSKQDRFLSVKLIKQGKIKSARILFNRLIKKVQSIAAVRFINKNLSSIKRGVKVRIKKIKAPVTKAKRRVRTKAKSVREKALMKKRRVVRKVKRGVAVRKQRKFVKQTIRYQMEKARPLREVTLQQLGKASDISKMNKFIDSFFDQMGKKQKIDISAAKFKQMKNVLKKRMRKAIKTGDKTEIQNFRISISKLARDMNKKSSKPDVKIIEKVGKTKRFRTIKDFDTPTKKGTYAEVKSGGQVLLQRVETKQVGKMRTKQVVQQRAKIVSVQKKSINLKPLVDFLMKSLSASAIKNISKSKQAVGKITSQAQLSKVLQDSAQDLKSLLAVSPGILSKQKINSAIAAAVNSKSRVGVRLRTRQVLKKKKKAIKVRLPKKFTKKTIKKAQPVFYIKIKKKGRMVNLLPRPLILRDAKDYLAYKVDKNLVRTGYFEPIGRAKKVVRIPAAMRGYFTKNKRKLRPYKIRVGKKKLLRNGYIEKRKYILDTKKEKLQLKLARKKALLKRKKTKMKVKRRVSKRSTKRKTAKKKKKR